MGIPVKIAFPDFPASEAVAARVRHRVKKLDQLYGRIIDCYVAIGNATKRHQKGNIYYVTVELRVPGGTIVYSRSRDGGNTAHTNVYVAIRDAFNAIERQLRDYIQQRRIRIHTAPQAGPAYGKVIRLVAESPADGYGFLAKSDGQEVYFNAHSVLNDDFTALKVGSQVRFSEEQGEDGPQASTVELIAA
ncbi:MAG TPA: 30S ribosomal protein S30 [Bdellovibrionales bacterium]|nr:MAG: hypothetical protein A2Z97_03370 [Bdellovibrionales bacterium GWB1_52_6]OFZ02635.1 MAG: hypothetical protein A2X97_08280 [Bdellovibrionales bacterium GWA1_52_35]OFZ43918.1 MAG: hypothetical protein A2070_14175 [Bdellovibrionales bacterium GWC1_52_8]HAR41455.1 30S ribosomal protein S30 [Bdellovibrionales bacterium]HCM41499.1 30S ribosomal protein S30 [Bdellovibrionales bacterium]